MFVWKITLIFLNILMVACVRNPNEIDYVEKRTFTPTLEELKTGKTYLLLRNSIWLTLLLFC